MNLVKCILTENDCYKKNRTIVPKGVMVHSTGANNPNVRRYAQPTRGSQDYDEVLKTVGVNRNANSWNRPGVEKCVHAFIGLLADGTVGTVQALPWDRRGWHAGTGTKGSANNTHIAFEICEDGLKDPEYFADVYREAAELTAYLCKLYGLDPLADGVVICHKEGSRRGVASNHVDVEHWFPKFGKTMDDFRRDVAELTRDKPAEEPEKGDDEDMTGEEIYKKLTEYLLSQKPPRWVEEQGEYAEAIRMGITDGSDPTRLMTRYEGAIMDLRVLKKATGQK